MNPGEFRHYITIQRATNTFNAARELTQTWAALASLPNDWAKIEPFGGTEELDDEMIRATLTHRITMRYRSDITVKDRILFESRVFNIERIINTEDRNVEMVILATEQVN